MTFLRVTGNNMLSEAVESGERITDCGSGLCFSLFCECVRSWIRLSTSARFRRRPRAFPPDLEARLNRAPRVRVTLTR